MGSEEGERTLRCYLVRDLFLSNNEDITPHKLDDRFNSKGLMLLNMVPSGSTVKG